MSVESVGPIPADLPAQLITPHEFQRFDIALTQTRESGDLRRRRRFRTVGQRARVQWLFTQAQFDTFWDWYEATLGAGASAFDLFVAAQGVSGVRRNFSSVWWIGQFAEPYTAAVLNAGPGRKLMYRVTADVVLRGEPSSTKPERTFRASGRVQHTGFARLDSGDILASGDITHEGGFYGPGFGAAGNTTHTGGVFPVAVVDSNGSIVLLP